MDECALPGKCSQRCTNQKGSYFCTCVDGYALADDKHNCKVRVNIQCSFVWSKKDYGLNSFLIQITMPTLFKVENRSAAYLIISNRVSMLTADLEQKSLEQIPVPVPIRNVVATTSDMARNAIYWSDMETKKINKLIKGGDKKVEVIVSSGLSLVEGLAYDWVADNIYWLDSKLNTIEVANADGSHRMILVNQNITQPRGLG